jgi:hypothetical protein
MGLYPSVTTILGALAKPELDRWKQQQVLLASLTLPRQEGETDDGFCSRVIEDAFKQVGDAADLGTSVHSALENCLQGLPWDEALSVYVTPVQKWVEENNVKFLSHEKRLISEDWGYAGTTDGIIQIAFTPEIGIIDFKTRKSKPGIPMSPWKTEPMQIAAYADAASGGCDFAVNLYISTTEPGRIEATWYTVDRLEREFSAFVAALKLWRHLNDFPLPQ